MKKLLIKDRVLKKDEVRHKIDKLDPNNNKNLPQNPIIEKDGKMESDDGFEHRTSAEAS